MLAVFRLVPLLHRLLPAIRPHSRTMSSSTLLPPRPPTGYSSLQVSPSQILLHLTISNKCGQSFRWRSVNIWERADAGVAVPSPPAPALAVKAEPAEDDVLRLPGVQPEIPVNGAVEASVKPDPSSHGNLLPQVKSESGSDDTQLLSDNASRTALTGLESTSTSQTEFSFCLSDRVVFVRQDEERGYIYHRTLSPPHITPTASTSLETELWLIDYLNLRAPLEDLYEEWAHKDPVFARFATKFRGIRMLRQDPWECLCAFICSSNNNIARIGQMVQNLCTHFAPKLTTYEYQGDDASMVIDYHPFPTPQALAQEGVEQKLRELGFGYRAKYIAQTAQMLCEAHTRPTVERDCDTPVVLREIQESQVRQGVHKNDVDDVKPVKIEESPTQPHSVHSYLSSLRTLSYAEARTELLQFQGVGPKVADCILLMSLDQASSIPVDRHVFQFAAKWYGLRNAKYETLAEYFRTLWGEYAGWAHSVLFTADLRAFKGYDGSVKVEGQGQGEGIKVEHKRETTLVKEETLASLDNLDPPLPPPLKRKSRTSISAMATLDSTSAPTPTRKAARRGRK